MSYSQLVSKLGPPLKSKKKKKKRLSDFGPPLLQIPGHAPDPARLEDSYVINLCNKSNSFLVLQRCLRCFRKLEIQVQILSSMP